MDTRKEIKGMADVLCADKKHDCEHCGEQEECDIMAHCEWLCRAGYRKADKVRKEMCGKIERLKASLADAVRSFTRMETLYKIKCNEVKSAYESAKKETAKEICERVDKWLDEIVPHPREETILICLLGWIKTEYGVEVGE